MSCSVCAGYDSYNCPCCGKEVSMTVCPECHGTGWEDYSLLQIHTRGIIKVSREQWVRYPADEDEAFDKGENLCRMPRERCGRCHGEGEIPE